MSGLARSLRTGQERRKGYSRRKVAHQRNSQAMQRKGLPCRIDGSITTQANSILHSETARSPDSRESRPDSPAKANMGTRGRGNENGGFVDDGVVPTRFCATPSPRFGRAWIAMPACFGSPILSLPAFPFLSLFSGAFSSWHILYLRNSESVIRCGICQAICQALCQALVETAISIATRVSEAVLKRQHEWLSH